MSILQAATVVPSASRVSLCAQSRIGGKVLYLSPTVEGEGTG